MATEIRDYGDKNTIVVFVDNNEVIKKLRKSTIKAIKIIPYWRHLQDKEVLVGFDFYYDVKHKKRLEKLIGNSMRHNVEGVTPIERKK